MNDFRSNQEVLTAGFSTIGGLFSSISRCFPDYVAVVEDSRNLTFEQLEKRTNQLARVFFDNGLKHGDRIAVLLRNCQEYLEIELAAAKSGIIVAAQNWRLGERELAHCIDLVEPKMLITEEQFVDKFQSGTFPKLIVGSDYEEQLARQEPGPLNGNVEPEDGLVILYTSGTTGLPKGALISHRAMVARATCFTSELNLPVASNFVAWAPFYHMASTDHALATLLRGGTVYVVDGYKPEKLAAIIEKATVGWFVLMPGMVGEFADYCVANKVSPKGITVCGAMADLVPADQIAAATKALNAPYLNSFGATETGLPPATSNVIPIGVKPDSLPKQQSAFCELRLVDVGDNDVADGEPGEIAMRGATLFSGYWKAFDTNEKDFRGGWFHMGDVMRRNPDGLLDYVDRVKYLIKSGGENIYPAEIEKIILKDSRVKEAVVVRRSDPKWGEVPVAFVVANLPNHGLTKQHIFDLCASDLSSYKHPAEVYFIEEDDLPRSTTGKIQRHELEKRVH